MNKPTYITCKDNEGNSRNLTPGGWSKITGKPERSIIISYSRKVTGRNSKSIREIVGLEGDDVTPTLAARFLRSRLV